VEEQINQAFDSPAAGSRTTALQPSFLRRVREGLRHLVGDQFSVARPVLRCNSPARFHLRRLLEPFLPKLAARSPTEIPAAIPIQSRGVIR
jgi:flagellar biosynthesis protein FlhA